MPPNLSHRMPPKKCLLDPFSSARTPVTFGTFRLCLVGYRQPVCIDRWRQELSCSRTWVHEKYFRCDFHQRRPAGPMARRLTTIIWIEHSSFGIKRLQVRSLRRSQYCSIDQATSQCCRLSFCSFLSELGFFGFFCQPCSNGWKFARSSAPLLIAVVIS